MPRTSPGQSIVARTKTERRPPRGNRAAHARLRPYRFTIIANDVDTLADDFEDRFFEAGCDDATIAVQKGAIILEFTREAKNFSHAIVSAIRDVRRAEAGIERVEPDHLVSLSDIAERSGLTRAAASLFAKGARGKGFPAPIVRVTTDSPLWDWVDVSGWLYRRDRIVPLGAVVEAKIVRALNAAASEAASPSKSSVRLAALAAETGSTSDMRPFGSAAN